MLRTAEKKATRRELKSTQKKDEKKFRNKLKLGKESLGVDLRGDDEEVWMKVVAKGSEKFLSKSKVVELRHDPRGRIRPLTFIFP